MVNVCFTTISNNTYGLPVLKKDTKCPNQVFYVWLVDRLFVQNRDKKRDSLQIMLLVYWIIVRKYVAASRWEWPFSIFVVRTATLQIWQSGRTEC
jgi:hypothetical protein